MNSSKILHSCISCGALLPPPLLVLEGMPCGAQTMLSADELSSDSGVSLPLCRCAHCGLAQFDCEPVDYYRDAIRVVGLSETMRDLRRADYRYLSENYGLSGAKWVELGCGNGDFLKVLSEFPVQIYGTEAGEPGLSSARSALPGAHIEEFFPDTEDSVIPGAPFDCFLSFNFLEHQPDPRAMLGCAYRSLVPGGIGLITVPSFEYILENGRCYEFIRDHIANYDLPSLSYLLASCGFEILEKGFIGIGDTLRVIVRKPFGDRLPGGAPAEGLSGYVPPDTDQRILDMRADWQSTRDRIQAFISRLRLSGRSLALWGAGHQGFTIASATGLGGYAKYIIDSSDKKQGFYAPASHLEIVPPEHFFADPADVIMITAPGYAAEIEKTIRTIYGGSGNTPAVCDIIDMRER